MYIYDGNQGGRHAFTVKGADRFRILHAYQKGKLDKRRIKCDKYFLYVQIFLNNSHSYKLEEGEEYYLIIEDNDIELYWEFDRSPKYAKFRPEHPNDLTLDELGIIIKIGDEYASSGDEYYYPSSDSDEEPSWKLKLPPYMPISRYGRAEYLS